MLENVFISSLLFWIHNSKLKVIFSHFFEDTVQLSPDLYCHWKVFCFSLYSVVWSLAAYSVLFMFLWLWSFIIICLDTDFLYFARYTSSFLHVYIDIFYQFWKMISHFLFTYCLSCIPSSLLFWTQVRYITDHIFYSLCS